MFRVTSDPDFKPRKVIKCDGGHRFEGMVIAEFTTLTGKHRCVVEAVDPRFEGLLFILRPDQCMPLPPETEDHE